MNVGARTLLLELRMVTPAQPAVVKAILRREAIARRDALPAAERQQAGGDHRRAGRFRWRSRPAPSSPGFMPLKSEINPLPLHAQARGGGRSSSRCRWSPARGSR